MKRNGKIVILLIVAVAAFFVLKPYIIGKSIKKVKIEVGKKDSTVTPSITIEDGTVVIPDTVGAIIVKPIKKAVKKIQKNHNLPPDKPVEKPKPKKKGKERENLDVNI